MRWFAICLLGFAASLALAARWYPGGTWFHPRSDGFSFWGNFWCDLLHSPALNGAANERGALAARVAFWLFAAALVRFWPLAARLSPRAGVRRWVSALGLAGALALVLVTLFSSRDDPELHGLFVVTSALLGVVAASLLGLAIYARASFSTRALSVALIASAAVSLVQYVRQGAGAEPVEWLAGAQKLTTLALLAFMLRCAWLVRGGAAAPGQGRSEPP